MALSNNSGNSRIHQGRWVLIFILFLGAFLRLYGMGRSCFWYDEAQTLQVARLPLSEIALTAYRPPLYHYLLHVWSNLVPSNEFYLRIPSFVFGMLALTGTALVTRHLYGRKTALLATLLAAVSPVMAYYSQELRMYSLMTTEFLGIFYLYVRIVLDNQERNWLLWAALGMLEALALYTHYFSAPFLVTITIVACLVLIIQRRWRTLGLWLLTQAAAIAAFIPWLLVIFGGRGGLSDYTAAELAPINPVVPTVATFLSQVSGFFLQGPKIWDQFYDRLLTIITLFFLLVTVLFICIRIIDTIFKNAGLARVATGSVSKAFTDLTLILICTLPLVMSVALFALRPGVVSPRHLMMLTAPLMILLARGVAALWGGESALLGTSLRWLGRICAVLMVLAALGVMSYSQLRNMLYPEHLRPNVRRLAQVVAQYANPEDVVLLPYRDYAFEYYYGNHSPVYLLETRVPDVDLIEWALPRLQGAQNAVLLHWVQVEADLRSHLDWFLQVNGRQIYREWVADTLVTAFKLNKPLSLPAFTPIDALVQPVRIISGYWPPLVSADQTLAVGLSWESVQSSSEDMRAAVRLVDSDGYVLASDDRYLLAEQTNAPLSSWQPGESARNYYLLALPVGTPPGTYSLEVTLYNQKGELPFSSQTGALIGTSYRLGYVDITPAASFPATFPDDISMTASGQELAPGLWLAGYTMDRDQIQAGTGVYITLYWKALKSGLPDYEISLNLVPASGLSAGSQRGAPANATYPVGQWQANELVTDRRLLRANSDAQAGTAKVILSVDGYGSVALGDVNIVESNRLFTLNEPQYPADATFGGIARLRGYALGSTQIASGKPFTLTLYWEALNEQPLATNYAVFTHLLDANGVVIAQHDGEPNAALEPTSTWVQGQIIIDMHTLLFADEIPQYSGAASLEVGLYDPRTFQRLALPDGSDHLVLPVSVTITE